MVRTLNILLLLLGMGLASCQTPSVRSRDDGLRYYDPSGHISYRLPFGWVTEPFEGSPYRAVYGPADGPHRPNMNFLRMWDSHSGAETWKSLRRKLQKIHKIKALTEETTFCTLEGNCVTWQSFAVLHDRLVAHQTFYLVQRGHRCGKVLVTCSAMGQAVETAPDVFREVIDSLRFEME